MTRVYVHEVAVRDGFQIEPAFVPTAAKIALIDELSATGLAKIEATAFVSPKAVPNLRDAEAVMRGIRRVPGVVYSALVPNAKGEFRVGAELYDQKLKYSLNSSLSRAEIKQRADADRQATNGTKLTASRFSWWNSSPSRVTRTSVCRPRDPMGITMRPPGWSCCRSGGGTWSIASLITMASKGPFSGQPK